MKVNINIALGLILYRITYEIVFTAVIEDYFGSIMLSPAQDVIRYSMSWVLLLFLIIPNSLYLFKDYSVSKGIVIFLLMLYYIPGTVYFAYRNIPLKYCIIYVIHYLFLSFFLKKDINFNMVYFEKESSVKILNILTLIMIGGSFLISAVYNNFQITLSLDDVYHLRAAQRDMNVPVAVGYFQPFAAIFLPFTITFFLDKKKYILVALSILVQIMLFSFGGMKTTIFLIPVVILCYFVIKKLHRTNLKWLITMFILLNIASLLFFFLFHRVDLVAYFQIRSMLTPNRISVLYYDFFTNNTPDFFRQSFLRYFGISSPYTLPVSKLIAQVYEGTNASLNNGLLGDVFMNFGIFGVILQPFLWSVMLRIMDLVTRRIYSWITISLVVAYGIIIPNMSLIGCMFTSGFLLMCFVIYTIPRDY